MVWDTFRLDMSLTWANGDEQAVRNLRLDLEERTRLDMHIFRKHKTENAFESQKADGMSKGNTHRSRPEAVYTLGHSKGWKTNQRD